MIFTGEIHTTPMIQTHLHQGALIRLRWRVINRLDFPE